MTASTINAPAAASPTLAVAIESHSWRDLPDAPAMAQAAVAAAARHCGQKLRPGAEASLLLADDETLRALNAQWRGQDKATNVLSFPVPRGLASPFLGDIAIAWETMQSEAEAEAKTVRDHFLHLVIHGFLHLLGYDHLSDDEAGRMEDAECAVLAEFGVANPYDAPSVAAGAVEA